MNERNILIIDDDPDAREIARMILSLNGFGVMEAADSADGFALATEKRPDLILLDLQIPQWGGLETIRKIRNVEDLREVPIVIFTAYRTRGAELAMRTNVCREILQKPCAPDEIVRIVKRFLKD